MVDTTLFVAEPQGETPHSSVPYVNTLSRHLATDDILGLGDRESLRGTMLGKIIERWASYGVLGFPAYWAGKGILPMDKPLCEVREIDGRMEIRVRLSEGRSARYCDREANPHPRCVASKDIGPYVRLEVLSPETDAPAEAAKQAKEKAPGKKEAAKSEVRLEELTKEFAEQHVDRLIELQNSIPDVNWVPDQLLRDGWDDGDYGRRGKKTFLAKWEHSVVAVDDTGYPVGLLLAYERPPDKEMKKVGKGSLYIHGFAVDVSRRGEHIGAQMMKQMAFNLLREGFQEIEHDEDPVITLKFDRHSPYLAEVYEKLGFKYVDAKLTKYKDAADHDDYIYAGRAVDVYLQSSESIGPATDTLKAGGVSLRTGNRAYDGPEEVAWIAERIRGAIGEEVGGRSVAGGENLDRCKQVQDEKGIIAFSAQKEDRYFGSLYSGKVFEVKEVPRELSGSRLLFITGGTGVMMKVSQWQNAVLATLNLETCTGIVVNAKDENGDEYAGLCHIYAYSPQRGFLRNMKDDIKHIHSTLTDRGFTDIEYFVTYNLETYDLRFGIDGPIRKMESGVATSQEACMEFYNRGDIDEADLILVVGDGKTVLQPYISHKGPVFRDWGISRVAYPTLTPGVETGKAVRGVFTVTDALASLKDGEELAIVCEDFSDISVPGLRGKTLGDFINMSELQNLYNDIFLETRFQRWLETLGYKGRVRLISCSGKKVPQTVDGILKENPNARIATMATEGVVRSVARTAGFERAENLYYAQLDLRDFFRAAKKGMSIEEKLYSQIDELLTLTVQFARNPGRQDIYTSPDQVKDALVIVTPSHSSRIIIVTPRAGPVDIETLKDLYRLKRRVWTSA